MNYGKEKKLYDITEGEISEEVVKTISRDQEHTPEAEEKLRVEQEERKETFYSDLIYTITHLRYSEQEARILWLNLLTHKKELSEKLGRNVGIRVAALDYFQNILKIMDKVKIIDADKYIETAKLAATDGLTGLYNHRCFQEALHRSITQSNETKKVFSLLILDIDNFKIYNDTNGHIAGDIALKEIAGILMRGVREQDFVSRYGGEEFTIIFPGLSKHEAKEVSEQLRKEIEEKQFPNQEVLPGGSLTVSGGISQFPDDGKSPGELINNADKALYLAKTRGKNQIVLYSSERRKRFRIPVLIDVEYFSEDNSLKGEAKATTLSVGGLSFSGNSPYPIGSTINIVLKMGGKKSPPIKGKIVWQRKTPGRNEYTFGVEFYNEKSKGIEMLEEHINKVLNVKGG